jgi:predicted porin
VTLYGLIDAAVTYTTKQTAAGVNRTGIDAGQLATSRWGMRGSEDLGGGTRAFFQLEGTLVNDTGAAGLGFGSATPGPSNTANPAGATTSLFDRAALVGLGSSLGSLTLGRQNMLGVDAIAQADPIALAHPVTNPNIAFGSLNAGSIYSTFGSNNGGAALRQNNSIRYATPVFGGGFGGAVMYAAGEQAGNSSAGQYTGINGYYRSGASGASLSYSKLKNQIDTDTLTLVGGGVKYAVNDAFTLKTTYIQTKSDLSNRKIAAFGLGVDYLLTPALTLTGAYYNTKSSGETAFRDTKADQYYVIGKYALSKRSTLYSTYTHARAGSALLAAEIGNARNLTQGLIGSAGAKSANRLTLGVQHVF